MKQNCFSFFSLHALKVRLTFTFLCLLHYTRGYFIETVTVIDRLTG